MSNSTVRPVLLVDTVVSGATGALLAIAAPMFEPGMAFVVFQAVVVRVLAGLQQLAAGVGFH